MLQTSWPLVPATLSATCGSDRNGLLHFIIINLECLLTSSYKLQHLKEKRHHEFFPCSHIHIIFLADTVWFLLSRTPTPCCLYLKKYLSEFHTNLSFVSCVLHATHFLLSLNAIFEVYQLLTSFRESIVFRSSDVRTLTGRFFWHRRYFSDASPLLILRARLVTTFWDIVFLRRTSIRSSLSSERQLNETWRKFRDYVEAAYCRASLKGTTGSLYFNNWLQWNYPNFIKMGKKLR